MIKFSIEALVEATGCLIFISGISRPAVFFIIIPKKGT